MKKLLISALVASLLAACASDNVEPPAKLTDISKPQLEVTELWDRGITGNNVVQRVNLAPASDGTNVYVASYTGSVYALSLKDGSIVWRIKMLRVKLDAGPAVKDGIVVVASSGGLVVALDPATGKTLWKSDLEGEILGVPAIGSGTVVVRTTDGRLVALAADTGKQRWKTAYDVPRLSVRGVCNPVILDRVVLEGLDDGRLVAVNLDDGSQLWQATVGTAKGSNELARLTDVDGVLAVSGDDVYAVAYRGQTVAITRSNGQIFWSRDLGSYTGVSADDENVYVSDLDGTVWALDKSNGAPAWNQAVLHARAVTVPVPFGDSVVVGDIQGYIHFLSKKDGSLMARDRLGSDPITAPPLVVGDVLVIQSNDGKIGAFTAQPKAGS
ncbi:MAG TPA: outer membrane protein assembly factor BamB [Gammaproteobacteria bacterium]|jgi:outer membrane protein assembly factor BamB|nr:outer membrane protein assembly factor BamB [Gammaproteobacteria bacterium]